MYKTIILYVPHFFRNTTMKEKRNFVHLNLCIALLIGSLIFVAGLETAKDSKVCITAS